MSSINGNDLTYPLIGDEGKSTMLTAADEDDPTFGVNSDGKVGLETPRKVDCAYLFTPPGVSFGMKDIKKMSGLSGDNIFSYSAHGVHSWGWIPIFMLGTTLRIFTWELHAQGACMIGLASLTAWQNSKFAHDTDMYADCNSKPKFDESCYEGRNSIFANWILSAEGQVGTLVRFILGMFASLVIANTYSKNRGLLGTVFAKVLGFGMMCATYIRPVNPDDPDEKEEVEKIKAYLVRLSNAGFRLMWIECRGEDGVMVAGEHPDGSHRSRGDSGTGVPHLMDGLLTKEEWEQIQHLESRITYIWQWCADCIADCTERGYIKSWQITTMMHHHLEELRGANVWGLPSLPYPYVLVVTIITKIYLILAALREGVTMGQIVSSTEYHDQDWNTTRVGLMFLIILYISITNFLYQGLLDLHTLLRDPNMDKFPGHMPTASFVKFTKNVTYNLILEPPLGRGHVTSKKRD